MPRRSAVRGQPVHASAPDDARDWLSYGSFVRYCPNPSCPHRLRMRSAAEFQAHIVRCSDCGADLVPESARAGAEAAFTMQTVAGPYRGSKKRSATARPRKPDTSRYDVPTGVALIALSALITLGTYALASHDGGGRYMIATGPFVYGAYRLLRGLSRR